jgi:hypothetical protein
LQQATATLDWDDSEHTRKTFTLARASKQQKKHIFPSFSRDLQHSVLEAALSDALLAHMFIYCSRSLLGAATWEKRALSIVGKNSRITGICHKTQNLPLIHSTAELHTVEPMNVLLLPA